MKRFALLCALLLAPAALHEVVEHFLLPMTRLPDAARHDLLAQELEQVAVRLEDRRTPASADGSADGKAPDGAAAARSAASCGRGRRS